MCVQNGKLILFFILNANSRKMTDFTQIELIKVKKFHDSTELSEFSEDDFKLIKRFYDSLMMNESCRQEAENLISQTTYKKDKHYDDENMAKVVTRIVEQYFKEKGRTVYPYGRDSLRMAAFQISEEAIQKRTRKVIKEIKRARDNCCHDDNFVYSHYDGGACVVTEEYSRFLGYVYDRYYERIGASWRYG